MTLKEQAVIILDELNKTMSINYNFEEYYLKRIMDALIIIKNTEKERTLINDSTRNIESNC